MSFVSHLSLESLLLCISRSNSQSSLDHIIICLVFDACCYRLSFHLSSLIGVTSLLLSGHIVHATIPVYRGHLPSLIKTSIGTTFDKDNHIWGSPYGAGSQFLSFSGSLKSDSSSLYPSDISHHHLALGVILILSAHLYRSVFSNIGCRITTLSLPSSVRNHELITTNASLGLALFFVGTLLSLVSQNMSALPPYPFMSFVTAVSIYIHHQFIATSLVMGSSVHFALAFIREARYTNSFKTLLFNLLSKKPLLLSTLSYVSIFLGAHSLGIFAHNDTVCSFGKSELVILLDPIFYISVAASTPFTAPLSAPDLLIHHVISFAIHTTLLVCLKGVLDSTGSILAPDKSAIGYSLP
jgi:photosystem I P700 chlorophyll a apoprotein A2